MLRNRYLKFIFISGITAFMAAATAYAGPGSFDYGSLMAHSGLKNSSGDKQTSSKNLPSDRIAHHPSLNRSIVVKKKKSAVKTAAPKDSDLNIRISPLSDQLDFGAPDSNSNTNSNPFFDQSSTPSDQSVQPNSVDSDQRQQVPTVEYTITHKRSAKQSPPVHQQPNAQPQVQAQPQVASPSHAYAPSARQSGSHIYDPYPRVPPPVPMPPSVKSNYTRRHGKYGQIVEIRPRPSCPVSSSGVSEYPRTPLGKSESTVLGVDTCTRYITLNHSASVYRLPFTKSDLARVGPTLGISHAGKAGTFPAGTTLKVLHIRVKLGAPGTQPKIAVQVKFQNDSASSPDSAPITEYDWIQTTPHSDLFRACRSKHCATDSLKQALARLRKKYGDPDEQDQSKTNCASCVGMVGTGSTAPQLPQASVPPAQSNSTLDGGTCHPPQNYLQRMLKTSKGMPSSYYIHHPVADTPMNECIKASEQSTGGEFLACDGMHSYPRKTRTPSCNSTQALNLAANSFHDVTGCLHINPKLMFGLINEESGFRMNIVSPTGAAGFGQFTGIALEDVNQVRSRYELEMARNPNPECQRLLGALQAAIPAGYSHRCEAVAPPNSAVENMIYTGILFRENYSRIGNDMQYVRPHIHFSSGAEREKIEDVATVLAHNAGAGRARQIIQRFARYHAHHRDSALSLYDQFLNVLNSAGGEAGRYIFDLKKKARQVEVNIHKGSGTCADL